jgi:hypothetical protein
MEEDGALLSDAVRAIHISIFFAPLAEVYPNVCKYTGLDLYDDIIGFAKEDKDQSGEVWHGQPNLKTALLGRRRRGS